MNNHRNNQTEEGRKTGNKERIETADLPTNKPTTQQRKEGGGARGADGRKKGPTARLLVE